MVTDRFGLLKTAVQGWFGRIFRFANKADAF